VALRARPPVLPPSTRAEHQARAELQRKARAAATEGAIRWLESSGHAEAAAELRTAFRSGSAAGSWLASPRDTWQRDKLEAATRVLLRAEQGLVDCEPVPFGADMHALGLWLASASARLLAATCIEPPNPENRARFYRLLAELAATVLDIVDEGWRAGPWVLEGDDPS